MPIRSAGQQEKKGRTWACAVLAALVALPLSALVLLVVATVQPIEVVVGSHQLKVHYTDDRELPIVIPLGITGGFYLPNLQEWDLHISHAVWIIYWEQRYRRVEGSTLSPKLAP